MEGYLQPKFKKHIDANTLKTYSKYQKNHPKPSSYIRYGFGYK